MDIALTISNREISPAVVNLFQFENNTTTLNFTLDSYMYGEVDLRNYKAYGITSINGQVDMVELTMAYDSAKDKLVLSWDVKEFTLRQEGAILYQICFKQNANDGEGTGVFYSYKGVMINREAIDADNKLTADYPTILKQWLDRINELAGTLEAGIVYIPYGETIPESERLSGRLYFQYTNSANTKGRFEDHECNVLEMGDYLPLAGGKVSGAVVFETNLALSRNANTSELQISGGTNINNGGSIITYGKESPTNAGGVMIRAKDDANTNALLCLPDGTLRYGNKNIVRSVNNVDAGANGDVSVDVGVKSVNGKTGVLSAADTGCLPLSGGTMSGGIDLNGKALKAGAIELDGAINFHYEGSTDDYTSRIVEDAQGKVSVIAPNGVKVNGKDMVRSVDGVVADNAGNVQLNAVHKSGDETIGGAKTFTSEIKVQGSPNAYRIVGASYGSFWRQDEKNLYLMLTDAGDPTGAWNNLRPFMLDLATGAIKTITPDSSSNDTTVATTAWATNKFLPIAGGTMNGTLKFSATVATQKTTDNSYVEFRGATSYLNGAYLRLDGKDSGQPGRFTLATGDGSKNIALKGSTDGGLEWNGQSVAAMSMPSGAYTNLTLGASNTEYTAPADGWYVVRITGMSSGHTFRIVNNFNALDYQIDTNYNSAVRAAYMPVKKGQTVKITYSSGKSELFRFVYAEGEKHLKA